MANTDRAEPDQPVAVTRAAEAAGLGCFVRSDVRGDPVASLIFFGVLVLVGGLVLGLDPDLGWRPAGIALLVLAAAMIGAGAWALRHPRAICYCFEQGLVLWRRQDGSAGAYRFGALVGYERIDSGEKYRIHRLRVRTADGDRVFDYAGARAVDIADRIAAVELPRARARLVVGETVRLGRYRLSRESLSWDRITVPWSEIVAVQRRGEVDARIVVSGRRRPYPVHGSDLPHWATLIRLITELSHPGDDPTA